MKLTVSKNTLILVSILLVTFIFIVAIFLYTPPTKNTTPNTFAPPAPTLNAEAKSRYNTLTTACKAAITYPKDMSTTKNNTFINPTYNINDYNLFCAMATGAANPQVIDKSGKPHEQIILLVQQTPKNAVVSSIPITSITNYIQATGTLSANSTIGEKKQAVTLGNFSGYYIEVPSWPLPAVFVFEKDRNIYTIAWNKEYSGNRKTDIFPMLSIMLSNSTF